MSWKTLLWPWGRIRELNAQVVREQAAARLLQEQRDALHQTAERHRLEIKGQAERIRSLEAILMHPLKDVTRQRIAFELARVGIEKIRDLIMQGTASWSDRRSAVQVTIPLDAALFLGDRRSWETSLGRLVADEWTRQCVQGMSFRHEAVADTAPSAEILRIYVPDLHYRCALERSARL